MKHLRRINALLACSGPDLKALADKRAKSEGPAAYWHTYGERATLAASDPYASHLPVLKSLLLLGGVCSVMETGGGDYSTPLLVASGKPVVTLETIKEWAMRCLSDDRISTHRVFVVEPDEFQSDPDGVLQRHGASWSALSLSTMMLVLDHGPMEADRIPLLLCDTARNARWIVLHDAQDSAFAGIDWRRWKHAVMVKNHLVWTAVVSDHADPMEVLGHLPGVTRA